jgi:8-oxo-dGTP pyrophosphatase MutT (NUDIX family)
MTNGLFQVISQVAQTQGESDPTILAFLSRLDEGALTRDENPYTHFCVYFAAYDPAAHEVFLGYHKKANLWVFNGGHIDRGELPSEAVHREIGEEWGLALAPEAVGEPRLLTITDINNPAKQTCTRHYDIWHFVPLSKTVVFDAHKLAQEFHETRWLSPAAARQLVTDPATLRALSFISQTLFSAL